MVHRCIVLLVILFGATGCLPRDVRNGETSLKMGDAPRAIRFFSMALDRDPSDLRARRGLGLAMIENVDRLEVNGKDDASIWSDALHELSFADTIGDSVVRTRLLLGRLGWARATVRRGDTAEAIDFLEGLVGRHATETKPRSALAVLLARQGMIERAEALFLENAVLDSSNADTWFNLGVLAWNQGHRVEAAKAFLSAQKIAPSDPEILWWTIRTTSDGSR